MCFTQSNPMQGQRPLDFAYRAAVRQKTGSPLMQVGTPSTPEVAGPAPTAIAPIESQIQGRDRIRAGLASTIKMRQRR